MRNKTVSYVIRAALLLVTWAGAQGCMQPSVQNKEQIDVITEASSPANVYVATVYTISGGGAAGYVYKVVNLRKEGERFDPKRGVIFSATGTRTVTLLWEDREHLIVKHSKAGNVYTRAQEWVGSKTVRITYETTD